MTEHGEAQRGEQTTISRARRILSWIGGIAVGLMYIAVLIVVLWLMLNDQLKPIERTTGAAEWLKRAAQWGKPFADFTPPLAVVVAAVVAWVGIRNLRLANRTLEHRRQADAEALVQRQTAEGRAEWWRRVQDAVNLVVSNDGLFSKTGFELFLALGADESVSDTDFSMLVALQEQLSTDSEEASAMRGAAAAKTAGMEIVRLDGTVQAVGDEGANGEAGDVP